EGVCTHSPRPATPRHSGRAGWNAMRGHSPSARRAPPSLPLALARRQHTCEPTDDMTPRKKRVAIRQLASYEVKPAALDRVLAAISEFVKYVRANEPGTLRYD